MKNLFLFKYRLFFHQCNLIMWLTRSSKKRSCICVYEGNPTSPALLAIVITVTGRCSGSKMLEEQPLYQRSLYCCCSFWQIMLYRFTAIQMAFGWRHWQFTIHMSAHESAAGHQEGSSIMCLTVGDGVYWRQKHNTSVYRPSRGHELCRQRFWGNIHRREIGSFLDHPLRPVTKVTPC